MTPINEYNVHLRDVIAYANRLQPSYSKKKTRKISLPFEVHENRSLNDYANIADQLMFNCRAVLFTSGLITRTVNIQNSTWAVHNIFFYYYVVKSFDVLKLLLMLKRFGENFTRINIFNSKKTSRISSFYVRPYPYSIILYAHLFLTHSFSSQIHQIHSGIPVLLWAYRRSKSIKCTLSS